MMKPVEGKKELKLRQFKKVELAKPKEPTNPGCTPSADPDAPPC